MNASIFVLSAGRGRRAHGKNMRIQVFAVFAHLAAAAYETRFHEQTIDHFDARNSSHFRQRYLIDFTHWGQQGGLPNGCRGPILFYTGNEGPITAFAESNGFMTKVLAPAFGALVVFGEARYYGLSQPEGGSGRFTYLSTEQILADYASLLIALRAELKAESCPAVAFGGSYGGTLTTLFRLKYPHVVAGGLAASAPLGYYAIGGWAARNVKSTTWFDIVRRTYDKARKGCYTDLVDAVRLANATAHEPGGPGELTSTFGLCAAPAKVDAFIYWITEALESIPQIDYPEPSGSLPASPVARVCELDWSAPLVALAKVAVWFYGKQPKGCIAHATNDQIGGGTPGDGPEPHSPWGYQSCTETLHPFSTAAGAWRSYTFDDDAIGKLCASYYGVRPRLGWLEEWSGGYAIADRNLTTNLIWSNGRLDPWSGGGFLRPSDAVPGGAVFVMEKTAHHQDLRAPCNADPAELVEVRKKEKAIIWGWILQAVSQRAILD